MSIRREAHGDRKHEGDQPEQRPDQQARPLLLAGSRACHHTPSGKPTSKHTNETTMNKMKTMPIGIGSSRPWSITPPTEMRRPAAADDGPALAAS